jgi:hypothetical protein
MYILYFHHILELVVAGTAQLLTRAQPIHPRLLTSRHHSPDNNQNRPQLNAFLNDDSYILA